MFEPEEDGDPVDVGALSTIMASWPTDIWGTDASSDRECGPCPSVSGVRYRAETVDHKNLEGPLPGGRRMGGRVQRRGRINIRRGIRLGYRKRIYDK